MGHALRRTALGAALLTIGLVFPVGSQAQEPTATTDVPQPPPPEVIHCARPFTESIIPSIVAPETFAVVLDEASASARLLIPDLPANATCYAVFKTPTGTNPVAQDWDPDGVAAPGELVDNDLPSAGEYCYELIVGNPTGRSEGVERCIDVPPGVAPTATPVVPPSVTPPTSPGLPGHVASPTSAGAPGAPDAGSGRAGGGESVGADILSWVVLASVLVGAAGTVAVPRFRRKR